jgi:DNA-nicking Smr family endonuclease
MNTVKTLDLHGVKHAEVRKKLDDFIYEHMKKKTPTIHVITGSSEQMKRIVRDLVLEYGMDCFEDPTNSGKLIIKIL